MRILGLNALGFCTSSALIEDGRVLFAVEEERLNRQKRTRLFPSMGIQAALAHSKISMRDIDAIAIAWNPTVNLESHNPAQSQRHRYLGEALYSVPSHLMQLVSPNYSRGSEQTILLEEGGEIKIHYISHHLSHASTFFLSGFDNAAILSVDAFGEKQTTVFSEGSGNLVQERWSQEFPHSLAAFYSLFTEYCGFQPQSDEWKLMGAGPYGDPKRFYKKLSSLISLTGNRGFELDLSYFNHYQFHRPHYYTPKLIEFLGIPPNQTDKPLTETYYDLAAAAQQVFEESYFGILKQMHAMLPRDNLVLSGGVALNSVANGKVLENTPFKQVFISSVPDDSGGALGAAFYLYHTKLGMPRTEAPPVHNYFGPEFADSEIKSELQKYKIPHTVVDDPARAASDLIAEGKIIGWFQGRIEFGDRALGNRSILADPRDPTMRDRVNETVKYREPFRPFAPAIMIEHVDEYFINAAPTPFMEKVFKIRPEKRAAIPAVTHADGSGRLQTVSVQQNPRFYELIKHFKARTGVPVVLNTSFNLKGEPVVCSPVNAIRTFFSSGLDALVMGNIVITKQG